MILSLLGCSNNETELVKGSMYPNMSVKSEMLANISLKSFLHP